MAAITWRNVDAPNLGDPTRTGMLASNSINNAFDILNKQLTAAQAVDSQNWDARKALNTDQYLSRLQSFKTPEEAAAAQAELQGLRQGFQAQIDMPAVRNVEANLTENLQRRVTTNNAYVTSQEDFAERDAVADLSAKVALGGTKALNEGLAANPNLSARARAALAAAARKADFENEDQGLRRNADARAQQALDLQRRQVEIQVAEAAARRNEQIRARAEAAALKTAQAGAQGNAAYAAQLQAAKDQEIKNGRLSSGTLDTVEGKKAFIDLLTTAYGKDSEVASAYLEKFLAGFPGGKFTANWQRDGKIVGSDKYGVPVADAISMAIKDRDIGWYRPEHRAAEDLGELLRSKGYLDDYRRQLNLRDGGAAYVLGMAQQRAADAGVPFVVPPGKVTTPPKR